MSKKDKIESTEEIAEETVNQEDKAGKKGSKSSKKSSKEAKWEAEKEELEAQVSELKDKYIRLVAEFDNYKKRTVRERLDLMATAAQDTLAALLPVLDDFDRAKKNAEDENSKEPFSEGVMLVYNKLYGALQQRGLEPMESNGEAFDPEFHEAITEIPAPSDDMKGKVIDTVEKGYKLKEKIIRYAKVVVGK
ncbi:MAG: nucleotide exchange factor GrpE [Bacteroidota bacterium]